MRIAQVEAGGRRDDFAEVHLSEVFTAIAEAYGPMAEDAWQTLAADVEP